MLIRRGTPKDTEAVFDILNACFDDETIHMFRGKMDVAEEVYRTHFSSKDGQEYLKNCLLAEEGGRVVGAAGLQYPKNKLKGASSYPLHKLIRKAGLFTGIFIKLALGIEDSDPKHGDALYVDFLGVLPEYENKGIGTKLLKAVERLAKQEGFKKLALDAWTTNTGAIRLYKRMGYKETGKESSRVVGYFLGHREYVLLEKGL